MYAEGDDEVACFGCSHPLVDGSVQLFGRAPLAAFNCDAAQKGEIKEGGAKGGGGGPASLLSVKSFCFCNLHFQLYEMLFLTS